MKQTRSVFSSESASRFVALSRSYKTRKIVDKMHTRLEQGVVLAGETSSSRVSRVCVESRDVGIREASIFLSLSPFSFHFTHVHLVALVNIFLLLVRRNDSLYTRCIARERARTVTYGHARSLTHSHGPIHMPYIKECIPHSGEHGDEKGRGEEGSSLPSRD